MIKSHGKVIKYNEITKEIFIKAILSRLNNLAIAYGKRENKAFINLDSIDVEFNLKPSPMKRKSYRKKKKMIIPAFEGEIEIKGEVSNIYPYIKAIEFVNLGKSTSLGLGKVKIIEAS